MEGELKKLKIESYTDPEYQGGPVAEFEVMFNPKSYAVKYAVEYDEEQGMGTTGLPQRFKASKPSEFGVEFVLDGTGASADKVEVADKIDEFLAVAYEYDGDIHRPRYLRLAWGTLLFNCVFKTANVTYTLFKPDGSPLRAKVNATFFGFVEDKRRAAEEGAKSPDLTRLHIVRPGESLPQLAHRYYGDQMYYLAVASVNGLTDFRAIGDGEHLIFPPIAKQ